MHHVYVVKEIFFFFVGEILFIWETLGEALINRVRVGVCDLSSLIFEDNKAHEWVKFINGHWFKCQGILSFDYSFFCILGLFSTPVCTQWYYP